MLNFDHSNWNEKNEIRFGHHNDIVASLHSSPCSTGQRPWQTYALEAEGNGDTPKYETEQVDHHFMHHLIITRTLNTYSKVSLYTCIFLTH